MNESKRKDKGIFDKIIVIWFVIAFLAIFISYSLKIPWLIIATFGHLFFGMGIMVTIHEIKGKKNVGIPIIVSIVGGMILAGSLFYKFGSAEAKEKLIAQLDNMGPYLIVSVFIILGIWMLYMAYRHAFILPKIYSYSIMATCIEVKSKLSDSDGNHGSKWVYCPVFSYYFNGNDYTVCNNEYTNMLRYEEGQQYSINIDPNEPDKFCIGKMNTVTAVTLLVVGMAFIGVGIMVTLMLN